jgi:hypothetical protein
MTGENYEKGENSSILHAQISQDNKGKGLQVSNDKHRHIQAYKSQRSTLQLNAKPAIHNFTSSST